MMKNGEKINWEWRQVPCQIKYSTVSLFSPFQTFLQIQKEMNCPICILISCQFLVQITVGETVPCTDTRLETNPLSFFFVDFFSRWSVPSQRRRRQQSQALSRDSLPQCSGITSKCTAFDINFFFIVWKTCRQAYQKKFSARTMVIWTKIPRKHIRGRPVDVVLESVSLFFLVHNAGVDASLLHRVCVYGQEKKTLLALG
jgi:hypothetical protein